MFQEVERFQMGVARFVCRAVHVKGLWIGRHKTPEVGSNPGYVAGGCFRWKSHGLSAEQRMVVKELNQPKLLNLGGNPGYVAGG